MILNRLNDALKEKNIMPNIKFHKIEMNLTGKSQSEYFNQVYQKVIKNQIFKPEELGYKLVATYTGGLAFNGSEFTIDYLSHLMYYEGLSKKRIQLRHLHQCNLN